MRSMPLLGPAAGPPAPMRLSELTGARESTRVSWHESVERAVDVMRRRMADPLALETMASAALLSPYHFNRVFRLVTGIPPGRFLTALRMAEAKRLLLSTTQRVTDICFAVGFESLGTFTTRFGQLVGVAPQELRRLAERHGPRSMSSLAGHEDGGQDRSRDCLAGWLDGPDGPPCVALVGLFDRAVPQGMPAACAMVAGLPGRFRIGPVAPGNWRALAIGFPHAESVLDATLLDPQRLLVGSSPEPLRLGGYQPLVSVRLRMTVPGRIDPPIVFAGPLLAAEAKLHRRA